MFSNHLSQNQLVAVASARRGVPCSTPFSTCCAAAALGDSCPRAIRRGRPCTVGFAAGGSAVSGRRFTTPCAPKCANAPAKSASPARALWTVNRSRSPPQQVGAVMMRARKPSPRDGVLANQRAQAAFAGGHVGVAVVGLGEHSRRAGSRWRADVVGAVASSVQSVGVDLGRRRRRGEVGAPGVGTAAVAQDSLGDRAAVGRQSVGGAAEALDWGTNDWLVDEVAAVARRLRTTHRSE